jgi:hypothetical protein
MRSLRAETRWLIAATIAAVAIVIGVALGDFLPWELGYSRVDSAFVLPSAVGAALFAVVVVWQLFVFQRRSAAQPRRERRRALAVFAVGVVIGLSSTVGWAARVTLNYFATGEEEVLASVCEPHAIISTDCRDRLQRGHDTWHCERFMEQRGGLVMHWPREGVCPDYPESLRSVWVSRLPLRGGWKVAYDLEARHALNGAWLQMTGRTSHSWTPSLGAAAAWSVYRSVALLLIALSFPFATRVPLRLHPTQARVRFVTTVFGSLVVVSVVGEWMVAALLYAFDKSIGNPLFVGPGLGSLIGGAVTFVVLRRRRFSRALHLAWPAAVFGICVLAVAVLQAATRTKWPWGTEGAWIATVSTVVLLALSPLLMAVNERICVLPE